MTTPATDVIFTPAGSGAVARVLADRLKEQISVKDYGALGDGVTDDSGAFINALAQGKNVFVPAGVYRIGHAFTLWNGLILTIDSGAALSVDAGVTVTMRGVVAAGQHQIFAGAGVLTGLRDVVPEWFGAVGNGTTDDQPALQRAVNCVQGSYGSDGSLQIVRLSNKTYGLARTLDVYPTNAVNIRIKGAGTVFGSRFRPLANFTGQTALAIHGQTDGATQVMDFDIGGFTIENTNGQGGLIGLTVGDAAAFTNISGLQNSLISDVSIVGFDAAVKIQRTRLVKFERCSFWYDGKTSAHGVILATSPAAAPDLSFVGDLDFENCQFVGTYSESGFVTGLITEILSASNAGISGVRCDKCIFYHLNYSVFLQSDYNVNISDFWVVDCQFDGNSFNGLYLKSNGSPSKTGFVTDVHVHGNYFQGMAGPCISIQSPDSVSYAGAVRSISIQGNWANGVSHAFVDSYRSRAVSVSGNQLSDFNYAGPVIEFHSMRDVNCANNTLWSSGGAVATHMVQVDGPSDWYVVTGNSAGGAVSGAVIQDSATGTHKVVASNI